MTSHARRADPDRRSPAIQPAITLRSLGAGLLLTLLRWHELARQRRQLLSMDDRMLKDIGITRASAQKEGHRPFWDERGVEWRPWR